jgi:hypothetical protein
LLGFERYRPRKEFRKLWYRRYLPAPAPSPFTFEEPTPPLEKEATAKAWRDPRAEQQQQQQQQRSTPAPAPDLTIEAFAAKELEALREKRRSFAPRVERWVDLRIKEFEKLLSRFNCYGFDGFEQEIQDELLRISAEFKRAKIRVDALFQAIQDGEFDPDNDDDDD